MSKSSSTSNLASLFNAALKAVTQNREQINELDGYNGDHGDNMVENLQRITEALRSKQSLPPADALRYASEQLEENGQGGSSKYYAEGLREAAEKVGNKSKMSGSDVMNMVMSLLSSLPSEGYPEQASGQDSALQAILALAGGQPQQPQRTTSSQASSSTASDLINTLLPAGLAFLQAKQAGADNTSAAMQAAMRSLIGGGTNPLQTSSPRAAAGGLIAQSILKALLG